MPSPTLITVPTSITVTPASKFSICWLMMSLISFALIGSMIHFRFAIANCQFDLSFNRQSKIGNRQCLARHSLFDMMKMIAHRAVVNGRADPRDNAAEQIRIGGKVDAHFFAGQSSKLG